MREISVKETAERLLDCDYAYILIHRSPDGDCIGAGYALLYALRAMGKKAKVYCNDEIPARYRFMIPECETTEDFQPEIIISADIADEQLFGDNLSCFKGKVDLAIDHHISNTGFAKETCLDGKAAAACQVVYEIFREMKVEITREIAVCLYTGIATDTGCFMYDNAGARTHAIAGEIMAIHPEIPYGIINRNMFTVKSMGRIRLDAILADRLESYFDGKCTMVSVTKALMEEYSIDEAELEGIAGFPLQVEGAEVGVVLKEREVGIFRISMRSADKVNVSEICSFLGGGGHIKAAGCSITGTEEEAKAAILEAVAKGLEKI